MSEEDVASDVQNLQDGDFQWVPPKIWLCCQGGIYFNIQEFTSQMGNLENSVHFLSFLEVPDLWICLSHCPETGILYLCWGNHRSHPQDCTFIPHSFFWLVTVQYMRLIGFCHFRDVKRFILEVNGRLCKAWAWGHKVWSYFCIFFNFCLTEETSRNSYAGTKVQDILYYDSFC